VARTVRRALAGALAGLLVLGGLSHADAAPAASPTAAPAARPPASTDDDGLAWQLRGAAGTVYIAGSMHLLRAGDSRLPRTYEAAYREAERLVMEIDVDDLDPAAAAAFTAGHATYPPGPGLRAALGERRWQRARSEFARVGLQIESFDRLEPWAASLVYSVAGMARLGFEPELGVEEQLKTRAAADGKDITGLETLEFQLGLFDALSPADQARLLDLTIDDADGSAREIDRLTAAWSGGDVAALSRLLLREYRRFPTLYEALVYRRNRDWVPQVEALLQRDGDSLVVVGAMHLVGRDSLIELLRRRGLDPRPMRGH
jgi:uncharacterized protein YbaP (TraB family)